MKKRIGRSLTFISFWATAIRCILAMSMWAKPWIYLLFPVPEETTTVSSKTPCGVLGMFSIATGIIDSPRISWRRASCKFFLRSTTCIQSASLFTQVISTRTLSRRVVTLLSYSLVDIKETIFSRDRGQVHPWKLRSSRNRPSFAAESCQWCTSVCFPAIRTAKDIWPGCLERFRCRCTWREEEKPRCTTQCLQSTGGDVEDWMELYSWYIECWCYGKFAQSCPFRITANQSKSDLGSFRGEAHVLRQWSWWERVLNPRTSRGGD